MEENQLTQPILNPINAFDASMDYTFTFVSIGGNQVVANILTIIDNSNGEEVYKETQSTMRLEHILPANTLENGNYYSASIQTVDNAEQVSQSSIAVPFYCYSTPSLTINNMPINGTINNNSYTFRGSYSQLEGELLNSYQFILYNNNKEVISKTNIIYYDTDNSLSYNITGMSSNTSYFIELTGVTVNGTRITSGLLPFNVNYSQAASFAICDLVNDCDNGYIQISSNIVSISGNSNPNPPIYIDDKEVDLTEEGSWVNWDNGFNIQDDFTLRAWGRNFNDFENIIELKNPSDTNGEPNKIDMKWMTGNIKKELPEYTKAEGNSVYLDDSKEERIKNFVIEGNSVQKTQDEKDYGTNDFLQLETIDEVPISISVLGNEYQKTREGYNLLNNTLQSQTIKGVTVTVNEDKSVTLKGTATANTNLKLDTTMNNSLKPGTYTLKGCQTFIESEENNGWWQALDKAVTMTFTSTPTLTSFGFYLYIAKGTTVNKTYYPQLVEGTEEKPYEPHGASPSPDYPSEVEAVGDNVNLFDKDNANILNAYFDTKTTIITSNSINRVTYIKCNQNTVYTISAKDTKIFEFISIGTSIEEPIIGMTIQNIEEYLNKTITTYTTNDTANYLVLRYRSADIDSFKNYIKIEEGEVATSYSPYGMGSVEINKVNKNFLPSFNDLQEINKNGLTYSLKDNKLKIKGTSTTDGSFSINISENTTLSNGNYYLKSSKVIGNISCNLYDTNNKKITDLGWNMTNRKFTINGQTTIRKQVDLFYGSGATFDFEGYLFITNQEEITDYTPHESEVYNLPIQQPMLSGDTFVREDGNWFEVHGWDKIILTGDENINLQDTVSGIAQFGILGLNNVKSDTSSTNIYALSNSYLGVPYASSWLKDNTIITRDSKSIRIHTSEQLTVEEFKQFLKDKNNSGTPVYAWYRLATPTKLACTPEQITVLNQLSNNMSYKNTNNIYSDDELALINVKGIPFPNTSLFSPIYSLGDKKNLINIEDFNIEYNQQYSQDTNTNFILNGSYEYTISFDYVINSATTDLYYSIGYGKDTYETSIVENIQYNTQDNGRNYFTFRVPENISEGMYLWIKFANTIILSDVNVDISNIQLENGKNVTDYQSPLKYNIYPTVTRKNIFDYENPLYLELNNINLDLIQNGYNISPIEANKDAYISIGYKNLMQEGNDYTLSYSTLGNFKNMELFTVEKGTKNVVNPITLDNGSFVAPNCCYDIQIRFYVDSSSLQNSLQIWNIQIESGTVITDYETYESQIWDIELDNQLHGIENYKDIICIQNINYLNPENQQAEISENTIYYFSQLNNTTYYLWFYNEDNNLITFIYNGETVDNISGENFNFTSPEGTKYLKITKSNNAEANDVPKDEILSNMISVEEGENSIVYYPYINTPSIIKYFEEKTFNGSEGWFIGSAPTQESTLYLLLENTQTGLKSNIVNCMSYSLKSYSADYLWNNDVEGIAQSQTQIIIRISKSVAGDLDTFKQYLSNNNIYGIFRLQTPIVTELSTENINRLNKLSTYYPISNIFLNNNIQGSTQFKYVNNYDIQETKNNYILLKCYNNNMLPYIITSNYIDIPLETDKIFIWVRRVNNIFDLKIENLGDYSEGGGGEDKTNPIVTFDGEPIVTNNSISVTANCIDDNGLRTVRFSKNNGSTWDEEIAVDEISVIQEYTFTELDADTEYTIRVEAIDLSGNIGGISEKVTTSS